MKKIIFSLVFAFFVINISSYASVTVISDDDNNNIYKHAMEFINDEKFAKPCDNTCGGKSSTGVTLTNEENKCTDRTFWIFQT